MFKCVRRSCLFKQNLHIVGVVDSLQEVGVGTLVGYRQAWRYRLEAE